MSAREMTYRRAVVFALCGLPAAAVAAVWLVGDLSYTGRADGHLDYVAHPVAVPSVVITALGLGGAAGLALLVLALGRRSGVRAVLLCATASGVLLGVTYRIVTAGTIGANIGAGLAIMFLLPTAAALLLVALVIAARQRSRPNRTRTRSGRQRRR